MKMKLSNYTQPAFLICVAVLAAAAGGMSMTISYLGIQLRKLPLPLKKPLDEMDEAALAAGGYKVVDKITIENSEMLQALGTNDYIQWTLEDTQARPGNPVRYCSVFMTYYTGNPDQVPHVPEECYFGGGYQRIATQDITIETRPGDEDPDQAKDTVTEKRHIPARCLTFGKKAADIWRGGQQFPVLYFFKVNGKFAGSRDRTRAIMSANLRGKYAYYCKVEWRFFNFTPGRTMIAPAQDEAIAASSRLLDVILPILEKEHWPDWEKANKMK